MSTGTTHHTTHPKSLSSGPHRPSHRSQASPWGVGLRYSVMWVSAALVVALLVANALR